MPLSTHAPIIVERGERGQINWCAGWAHWCTEATHMCRVYSPHTHQKTQMAISGMQVAPLATSPARSFYLPPTPQPAPLTSLRCCVRAEQMARASDSRRCSFNSRSRAVCSAAPAADCACSAAMTWRGRDHRVGNMMPIHLLGQGAGGALLRPPPLGANGVSVKDTWLPQFHTPLRPLFPPTHPLIGVLDGPQCILVHRSRPLHLPIALALLLGCPQGLSGEMACPVPELSVQCRFGLQLH